MTIINFPGYKHLWWLTDGISRSDIRAVWVAKGALSLANSLLDRSGNGNNLTGATPTFNSSVGWTSKVLFNAISNLATPPYTIFWKGNWVSGTDTVGCSFFGNSANSWSGGLMGHSWNDGKIYVGHSYDAGSRLSLSVGNYSGVHTIVYQKYASGDNRHALYIDGTLNTIINAGAPTNFTFKLGTGRDSCAGALIYGKILDSNQIATILGRFNGI